VFERPPFAGNVEVKRVFGVLRRVHGCSPILVDANPFMTSYVNTKSAGA